MKNLLMVIIILFLSSCEKYQYIDEETRFNKSSGSIDILLEDGTWIAKSKRLQQIQFAKKQKEEKEKREREAKLQIFPFDERQKITGRGGFRKSELLGNQFFATIENNSNWKIEEIDFNVNIYSTKDSTYLTKRSFTGESYEDSDGAPFTKTEFFGYIPKLEDNQYNTWNIILVRGYKYEGK
jgi:hypothetical protein